MFSACHADLAIKSCAVAACGRLRALRAALPRAGWLPPNDSRLAQAGKNSPNRSVVMHCHVPIDEDAGDALPLAALCDATSTVTWDRILKRARSLR